MRKRRKQSSFDRAKKNITEQGEISEKTADAILRGAVSVLRDEQSQYNRAADEQRIKLAKELLENYNKIKNAISAGISSTVDVLDDTEFQRLMQREDSVKNQQVRSLAMKSATNRVLFLQINSALDEMKNVCRNDPNPRFRRQYDVLYSRYIRGWHVEAICTELDINYNYYFQIQREATLTFSLILFGAISPTCFTIENDAPMNEKNTTKNSDKESEQLRLF